MEILYARLPAVYVAVEGPAHRVSLTKGYLCIGRVHRAEIAAVQLAVQAVMMLKQPLT